MRRFPSSLLNVAFDGPDIREERLYHLFRVSEQHTIKFPPSQLKSLTAVR